MKCDYCEKDAIANFQKVWVRWSIKNGDYSSEPNYSMASYLNKNDEPTGENNIHVCKEHEGKLLDGEIDF